MQRYDNFLNLQHFLEFFEKNLKFSPKAHVKSPAGHIYAGPKFRINAIYACANFIIDIGKR